MKMNDTVMSVMTQTSCRLCLDNDDNLMNVFDVPDLDKIIYQCVCIKIVQSEPLPTGVCFKCIGELQNWSKFKKTCDDSQKTLLKHCKKSTMPPSITIQNIMNDSIEVDLSVFDHESLLDNLETSTNQSVVSFLPCHSTPLPEFITQNSIASQLFPSNDKEDHFKPIKREIEIVDESTCENSQEESIQVEHLNGTSLSCLDNQVEHPNGTSQSNVHPLNKEETLNNKSQNKVQEEPPSFNKIVFKKPLYVKSIERCYQGLKQDKERFPLKNRNYKCDPCGKQFTSFRSISYHDQIEHRSILESQGVSCNECAQLFIDKTRLETHILMQHSTRSQDYQCSICSRCYVSRQSLTSHMTSHSDRNKCENCGKRFTSASLLSVHIDRFHRKIKRHSCNTCDKMFYSRAEVNRHQRTVHMNIKSFRCLECNIEFSNRSALDCHTRSVHSIVKNIVCDQCGEGFKTQSQRWYHHRKMHDEYVTLFSCPLCQDLFITKQGYRIHVRTHRPREEIICFYCNRSFASKRNLIQHIRRIHTKPNKTCPICEQIYRSRHICFGGKRKIVEDREKSRRNKYRVAPSQNEDHTQAVVDYKEKPCQPLAEKNLVNLSSTTKELRGDTKKPDEKIWQCEQCENYYTNKFNLKRHMMRKHIKPKQDNSVSLSAKKPKLDNSVDTREEIMNSLESNELGNVVKERPNLGDTTEHRVDTKELRVDTPEPQVDIGHRVDTPEPRVDTKRHRVDTQEPRIDTPELRVDTKELRVDTPEPRIDTKGHRIDTQEPRIDTPELRVDTQKSRIDTSEPRIDTQEPGIDTPEPRVDTQEPRVVEIINTTGSPLIQIFTDR